MERHAVQSSNLKAVGYDEATQVLEVEFQNGNVYRYKGVGAGDHGAMMSAPSIGKAFYSRIRKNYAGERVEEDDS